jgi:hypothetical protein
MKFSLDQPVTSVHAVALRRIVQVASDAESVQASSSWTANI